MKLNVGQVVYVTTEVPPFVYPLMIVKELVERTLEGEKTLYEASTIDGSKLMLETVQGTVFPDAIEAKKSLFENATKSIVTCIDMARQSAAYAWPNTAKLAEPVAPTNEEENVEVQRALDNGERMLVTMPDGSVARVRMPA